MHDVNVIVLEHKYHNTVESKNGLVDKDLIDDIIKVTNVELLPFSLSVNRIVSDKEYYENTTREVNTYIKVRNKVKGEREKFLKELVKVATNRYEMFEKFSNIKYFSINICSMNLNTFKCVKCGKIEHSVNQATQIECSKCKCNTEQVQSQYYTLIWFNFHYALYSKLEGFFNLTMNISSRLSYLYNTTAMTVRSTSVSRQDDLFMYFYKGKKKHDLSGKAALTEVRDTYGIDVNDIYSSVDYNIALYFSNRDYFEARKQYDNISQRIKQVENTKFDDPELMTSMLNDLKLEVIQNEQEVKRTQFLMEQDYIGTLVFAYMEIIKPKTILSEKFG